MCTEDACEELEAFCVAQLSQIRHTGCVQQLVSIQKDLFACVQSLNSNWRSSFYLVQSSAMRRCNCVQRLGWLCYAYQEDQLT